MPDDNTGSWGRRTFLKTTGAVGAAAAVGATNVNAGRDPGPKENELVVNISGTSTAQTAEVEIQQTLPSTANVAHRNDSLNYLSVALPEAASEQARDRVKRQLESRSDVKSVERNVTFEAHANDPGLDQQYAPQQVRALDAWEQTLGSESIELGIIDSGVNWTHEDLEDQFGANKGEDFAGTGGDPPAGGEQHGTHVAGIASATTDNGIGVAGVSNSRIYSLRALGGGRGSLTDIADAIDWCANQGVDIINMSLGGGGFTDLMKNAVSNAYSQGVLIFASAGNDGTRDSVNFPAAYEECIAVSALNEGESLASFSSQGPEVEITGPGADVLSTVPGDDYDSLSGTSMSCPAVTGVAALGYAWARETGESVTNDEMRALVKQTARDVGLSSNQQGEGCANADALLGQIGDGGGGDPDPEPGEVEAVITASTDDPAVGESVDLDGGASTSDNGAITEYQWTTDSGGSATGQEVTLTRDEPDTVEVTLTVTDEVGETDSTSQTFDFGGDGGSCGDESTSGSAEGSISWWNGSDTYSYTVSLTDPCQLTVDLDGPSDADFDLYVTLDGRTPSPTDFDRSSETANADEQIVVESLDGTPEIGILVEGVSGWGSYVVSVEELGL